MADYKYYQYTSMASNSDPVKSSFLRSELVISFGPQGAAITDAILNNRIEKFKKLLAVGGMFGGAIESYRNFDVEKYLAKVLPEVRKINPSVDVKEWTAGLYLMREIVREKDREKEAREQEAREREVREREARERPPVMPMDLRPPGGVAMEEEGVPAFVSSYTYNIRGNVHIFPVQTLKGLYYKVVSDTNKNIIKYVSSDRTNQFEGFPSLEGFLEVPILKDNSVETKKLIDEQEQRMVNSQSYDRFASMTRPTALSRYSPRENEYRGLETKSGPFSFAPGDLNKSNLRTRSRGLNAKSLFNTSGLSRNWKGKTSLRNSLTKRNMAATKQTATKQTATKQTARKGWLWGGKKSRKTRRGHKKPQTKKRK